MKQKTLCVYYFLIKRKELFGQPNTMDLAPMEGVSPGPRSEMAMLLLFSDTGTLSTMLFRWPAACLLDPLGFSIVMRYGGKIYHVYPRERRLRMLEQSVES